MIEYSDDAAAEAGQGFRRIEGFLDRARNALGDVGAVRPDARPAAFDDAMDDDIGVPQALAVLHEHVRAGNAALAAADLAAAREALDAVRAMLDVLGLDPQAEPWASSGRSSHVDVVDALVQVALDQRQQARARKDFAAADAIRDRLAAAGVRIEDTASGARWSFDD